MFHALVRPGDGGRKRRRGVLQDQRCQHFRELEDAGGFTFYVWNAADASVWGMVRLGSAPTLSTIMEFLLKAICKRISDRRFQNKIPYTQMYI